MPEWTLTGNTRYAMRGIFFRRPALQVEEVRQLSQTHWQVFEVTTSRHTRWRFANQADLLNLGIAAPEDEALVRRFWVGGTQQPRASEVFTKKPKENE